MVIGFIREAIIDGEKVIGQSAEVNIGTQEAGIKEEMAGTGGVVIGVKILPINISLPEKLFTYPAIFISRLSNFFE
jgi:hypothetical protein